MPPITELGNFRYLLVCEGISHDLGDHQFSARRIIDEITVLRGEPCRVCWLMSALTESSMRGKSIEIRFGPPILSESSRGLCSFRGPIHVAAGAIGPWTESREVEFSPPEQTCMAGVHAIDVDGAFGPPGAILSSFRFLIQVVDSLQEKP
jgi:hypothetical protein